MIRYLFIFLSFFLILHNNDDAKIPPLHRQKYGKTLNSGRFFPIFYNFAPKFNISSKGVKMKYKKITFHFLPKEGLDNTLTGTCRDVMAALTAEIGFEAFEDTDDGMAAYCQEPSYDSEALTALVSEFPIEGVSVSYEETDMADQDWNARWEAESYQPIVIDDRCVIRSPRSELSAGATPRYDLLIDVRQAFGTGSHETTRMMVSEILDIEPLGKRVLDCGTGTGILAIAALKAGAESAVAYDIDEWSVENARDNAALNHVDNIEVLLGDSNVLSHVSGVFDLVMANINRNVLISDLPVLRSVMSPDGELLLSGFLEQDSAMLIASAAVEGLTLRNMRTEGDWCMLHFTL